MHGCDLMSAFGAVDSDCLLSEVVCFLEVLNVVNSIGALMVFLLWRSSGREGLLREVSL